MNFCLWLTGLSFVFLWAQPPVTNQTAIETLFFKALDSVLTAAAIPGQSLNIEFENLNDEQKAFCRSRLFKFFDQQNFQLTDKNKGQRLVIQQFEPQIKYFESMGQMLGAGKSIKRRVSLKFSAYLVDLPEREARGRYWELKLWHEDQVDRTRIRSLEQSPFSFTRGNWVSFSAWTRILQPMVVIGSLTIVVYLFYSLRS